LLLFFDVTGLKKMTNSIKQEKNKLRKNAKSKISLLSKEHCQKVNEIICNKVINLPEYSQAKTIFCYVGTIDEINTLPILKHALENGKALAVPKCTDKGMMEAYQINSLEELEPGKYGILEPVSTCFVIEPANIELVIVPCLACTKDGNRLGSGGGYYDRYLKRVDCNKIALCRSELIVETLPVGKHDVKMDKVITDEFASILR
jgi:5-formyltetrahydrofolate cyclo-ligase